MTLAGAFVYCLLTGTGPVFPKWFSYFAVQFFILNDAQDLLLLFQHLWIVFSQADIMRHSMAKILHYSDFKSLRQAYVEIKSFIENEVGDDVLSLNTKIENDLRCAGDDNLELLEKFVAKFKLNISGFDYSKHFLSEGEQFGSEAALLSILTLPIHLTIWLIKLLTLGKLDFTNKQLLPDWNRQTLDLSFGDMLTWYLTGTYNLRQDVLVTLKKVA